MDDLTILAPEWLLDDPPAPPRGGMAVICRGPVVEEIRPAGAIEENGAMVRLPGVTLMPGLIDAHVHLTLCGCLAPRQVMMNESDDVLLLRAAENARSALQNGITTFRDCGDRNGVTFSLREAIRRGIVEGPNLVLSGPPLTTPRGHCYFMGGEVEGREQIARRCAELSARGANWIKVMATGGGLTPGTDSLALQFTAGELAFVVSEAAKHGLPVAAHAHSPAAIDACAAAGVRTIEHASFVTREAVYADKDILARLASRRSIAVPTCIPAVNAVREGRTLGLARELGISSEQFLDGRREVLRALVASGATVIAGSDAGATGVPFDSLLGEIELLAAEPWSNLLAIAAATSGAADGLGLTNAGRIAKGFPADMLAVRGNVAADIGALRRAVLVMRRGKIVRQEPI